MYYVIMISIQVAPAIDVALQKINSHSLSGATSHWAYPDFNLTASYADSFCDSAESLNHAIEFYMTGQVRNAGLSFHRCLILATLYLTRFFLMFL